MSSECDVRASFTGAAPLLSHWNEWTSHSQQVQRVMLVLSEKEVLGREHLDYTDSTLTAQAGRTVILVACIVAGKQWKPLVTTQLLRT